MDGPKYLYRIWVEGHISSIYCPATERQMRTKDQYIGSDLKERKIIRYERLDLWDVDWSQD